MRFRSIPIAAATIIAGITVAAVSVSPTLAIAGVPTHVRPASSSQLGAGENQPSGPFIVQGGAISYGAQSLRVSSGVLYQTNRGQTGDLYTWTPPTNWQIQVNDSVVTPTTVTIDSLYFYRSTGDNSLPTLHNTGPVVLSGSNFVYSGTIHTGQGIVTITALKLAACS